MIENLFAGNISNLEKLTQYSNYLDDFLNIDAVFSDETENFVHPCEPTSCDKIQIKIQTSKNNIDQVFLCTSLYCKKMLVCHQDHLFDYYIIDIDPIDSKFNYYFQLIKNNKIYYFNKLGISFTYNYEYDFSIIPNFEIPKWAKGAVFYQIFVDRFCNGDPTNDVSNNEYIYLSNFSKKIDDWNHPVESNDICNFYGGDLCGIIQKLEYLSDLGIDAIYLNPIFVSPSSHKYDIQDYDYVDPHFGVILEDVDFKLDTTIPKNKFAKMYIKRTTNKFNLEASNNLFIKLVELAHKHNIKVILDGVFNHCGAFNKWLDKENIYNLQDGYFVGAYQDSTSPYKNYFEWYDDNWPNNECYSSWWNHDNHPKLNIENSCQLYEYILDIAKKWVSPPYNADGWRLDVAADLGKTKTFNHEFWKKFRDVVKKANPNALIIAEHYGSPKDWLLGDQWDTIMNYDAFMEPLTWFLTGMEKHSENFNKQLLNNSMNFEGSMRYHTSSLSYQSMFCSMNEISNHDHSRFLTRTNMTTGRLHTHGYESASNNINLAVMMEAVVFQMTWPGCPTIYYGDEVGLCGWTDPDNRRTYPWGNENKMLLEFHKSIINIHRNNPEFLNGSAQFLYSNYGIISFARWIHQNISIVILNNNSHLKSLCIPVWKAHISPNCFIEEIFLTHEDGFCSKHKKHKIINGQLNIDMLPFSSIILRNIL